jgi:hypothetical protein
MSEEKKQRGRPRTETYINPAWKDIILQAGGEGKHITEFLLTLGLSWDQHYALLKRNTEYSQAVQEYKVLCENFWYNLAHKSMQEGGGQHFNSRLWSLIVRNKFPENWSESTKMDITTQGEAIDRTPIKIEIVKPNEN